MCKNNLEGAFLNLFKEKKEKNPQDHMRTLRKYEEA